MATTFDWKILNIERAQDDYVTIVHVRCDADDGANTNHAAGTVGFNQEEGEEIIPFADLTEELVWGWVWEKLNKAEVETALQSKLDEMANPPLISGLPWS